MSSLISSLSSTSCVPTGAGCCDTDPVCSEDDVEFIVGDCNSEGEGCFDVVGCVYVRTATPCDPPEEDKVIFTFDNGEDCLVDPEA